jgi:hypothetical protein
MQSDREGASVKCACHDYRFDVVWKGTWYRLGSLSDHHRARIDPTGTDYLLLDWRWEWHTAPKAEVFIPDRPIA